MALAALSSDKEISRLREGWSREREARQHVEQQLALAQKESEAAIAKLVDEVATLRAYGEKTSAHLKETTRTLLAQKEQVQTSAEELRVSDHASTVPHAVTVPHAEHPILKYPKGARTDGIALYTLH